MLVIVLGPNPLLQIGQRTIVIGKIRSRPQQLLLRPKNIIKVGLATQSERSALPVKTLHTCQSCIYREASASLYHTLTCSFLRVAHLLERTICIGLSYLLTLYWQFMIRKFLLCFLPLEGFPG